MNTQQKSSETAPSDSGWNSYWSSAGSQHALSSEGFESLGFKQHWLEFFKSHLTLENNVSILDAACGNGLLTSLASHYFKHHSQNKIDFHCLDASSSAISVIQQELPWAQTVVADAKEMPYEDGHFDLVISHFGIEYADLLAVNETVRLLKKDGELMFICHCKGGEIFLQCQRHLELMKQFLASDFLKIARQAFEKKIALSIGKIGLAEFETVNQQLISTIQQVKVLIQTNQREPVAQTLKNIFVDVEVMYKNTIAYHPKDIFAWFDVTVSELEAYPGRMQSMLNAALDEQGIGKLVGQLLASGAEVTNAKSLLSPQDGKNVAWLIQARAN